jgi:hypothetical protein
MSSELDDLLRRVDELERKLAGSLADDRPTRSRRRLRGNTFMGIVILLVGLVWLGRSYDIGWLDDIRFWPAAVILFGLFLIFGDRVS